MKQIYGRRSTFSRARIENHDGVAETGQVVACGMHVAIETWKKKEGMISGKYMNKDVVATCVSCIASALHVCVVHRVGAVVGAKTMRRGSLIDNDGVLHMTWAHWVTYCGVTADGMLELHTSLMTCVVCIATHALALKNGRNFLMRSLNGDIAPT